MIKILQNLQTLFDDTVTALSFDMRNKADATGIVFLLGVVEALGLHDIAPVGNQIPENNAVRAITQSK